MYCANRSRKHGSLSMHVVASLMKVEQKEEEEEFKRDLYEQVGGVRSFSRRRESLLTNSEENLELKWTEVSERSPQRRI